MGKDGVIGSRKIVRSGGNSGLTQSGSCEDLKRGLDS